LISLMFSTMPASEFASTVKSRAVEMVVENRQRAEQILVVRAGSSLVRTQIEHGNRLPRRRRPRPRSLFEIPLSYDRKS